MRFHGLDEIKCPYCAYEFSDSFEAANANDEKRECPRCDNVFRFTAVHSLTFDCDRLESANDARSASAPDRETDWDEYERKKRERIAEQNEY